MVVLVQPCNKNEFRNNGSDFLQRKTMTPVLELSKMLATPKITQTCRQEIEFQTQKSLKKKQKGSFGFPI